MTKMREQCLKNSKRTDVDEQFMQKGKLAIFLNIPNGTFILFIACIYTYISFINSFPLQLKEAQTD